MIKLVFGSKNKIIKLEKPTFQSLNSLIKQSFNEIPIDYSLSYLDTDKDQICLNSDEDLYIMLNSGIKINKIYIKQSLSQVIEITDQIEPSFQIYENKVEDKEVHSNTFLKKQNEQKIVQQIVPEKQVVEKASEVKEEDKLLILQQNKEQIKDQIKEQAKKQRQIVLDVIVPKEQPKIQAIEQPVNKSIILNISDTEKIQIQEQVLNSKILQAVKKVMIKQQESKKLKEQKKEVVVEEKQQVKPQKLQVKQEKKEVKIEKEQRKPQKDKRQQKQKKEQIKFCEADLIYHNVICSHCKDQYGIIGIRYQCILCDQYSLCSTCEETVPHEHALLKVKAPKQAVNKDQIINKYRKEIFESLPNGHYVPSISKDQANTYIEASKKMMNQSYQKTQKLMNDLFFKMEMSHKNPYEINRPQKKNPFKKEDNLQKINYLIDFLGINERQAINFCQKHFGFSKQQLLNLYMQKKASNIL